MRMPQSFSSVYVHAVFSTKDRRPFLREGSFRAELHAYLGGVSKNLECAPIRIGGVEDHVHILFRLSRTLSQADWVKEMKRSSTVWIKEAKPDLRDFAWQAGYACFSVCMSNLESVTDYIDRQDEHHRKRTFQDELRALLEKHRQDWDERYIWE